MNDQGWKNRLSGKLLRFGEKKIEILRDGDKYTFIITNANYSWHKWLPVLGAFVEVGDNKFSLYYAGESIIFNVDTQAGKEILFMRVPTLDKKWIRFISLRNLA